MVATLETTRLLLRPWSATDVDLLGRLSADPAVVRYIGDGAPWSPARARDVSAQLVEHWRANGFGWRVAVEKQAEKPVGFLALSYAGDGTAGLAPDEFEIGWWLEPRAWGRGLASEGAGAICGEAFERIEAPSVVARLRPENAASERVAQRLGMSLDFDTTGRFGEPLRVYRLLKEHWPASPGDGLQAPARAAKTEPGKDAGRPQGE